jgi:hypothetical protein
MKAWRNLDKATPRSSGQAIPLAHTKVRRDVVDRGRTVTLHYRSKLHHIGLGRSHFGGFGRLAGVDAHSNAQLPVAWPLVGTQFPLQLESCGHAVPRRSERCEEGLTMGTLLLAAMDFECPANDSVMLIQHSGVGVVT